MTELQDRPPLALEQLDHRACRLRLESRDTHATTLAVIGLAVMGEEFYSADSVEIFAELEETFVCHLPEEAENRISAWLTAVTTPAFFRRPDVFEAICTTFAQGFPDDPADDALSPGLRSLTTADLACAMYEVELAYDEQPEYGAAVRRTFFDHAQRESSEAGFEAFADEVQAEVAELKTELHTELEAIGLRDFALP